MNVEERRTLDQKRFEIDTKFNIAHIAATVAMVIALSKCGTDIRDVQVEHSVEIKHLKESREEVRDSLEKINLKLDRLIEQRNDARRK